MRESLPCRRGVICVSCKAEQDSRELGLGQRWEALDVAPVTWISGAQLSVGHTRERTVSDPPHRSTAPLAAPISSFCPRKAGPDHQSFHRSSLSVSFSEISPRAWPGSGGLTGSKPSLTSLVLTLTQDTCHQVGGQASVPPHSDIGITQC